jgi:hypothetical protein
MPLREQKNFEIFRWMEAGHCENPQIYETSQNRGPTNSNSFFKTLFARC